MTAKIQTEFLYYVADDSEKLIPSLDQLRILFERSRIGDTKFVQSHFSAYLSNSVIRSGVDLRTYQGYQALYIIPQYIGTLYGLVEIMYFGMPTAVRDQHRFIAKGIHSGIWEMTRKDYSQRNSDGINGIWKNYMRNVPPNFTTNHFCFNEEIFLTLSQFFSLSQQHLLDSDSCLWENIHGKFSFDLVYDEFMVPENKIKILFENDYDAIMFRCSI